MLKVFVLGRPGSGKTTAANRIITHSASKGCITQRFKDYEILYRMFQDDIERTYEDSNDRKFRLAEYGGFDVLDNTMFDVALEQLEKNVENDLLPDEVGIATIEFARDDYQETLSKFNSDFLQDAYFLFVDCDLQECVYRIYSRMSNPPKPDFHFVSEYIMGTYYSKENCDYISHHLRSDFPLIKKVETIENTNITLAEFEKKVENFAEMLVAEIPHRERELLLT